MPEAVAELGIQPQEWEPLDVPPDIWRQLRRKLKIKFLEWQCRMFPLPPMNEEWREEEAGDEAALMRAAQAAILRVEERRGAREAFRRW